MASIFQYTGQAIAYTLFAVVVGYFATQPAYTYFPQDKAQIKLSFGHAGNPETECRRLTQEELNQLHRAGQPVGHDGDDQPHDDGELCQRGMDRGRDDHAGAERGEHHRPGRRCVRHEQ